MRGRAVRRASTALQRFGVYPDDVADIEAILRRDGAIKEAADKRLQCTREHPGIHSKQLYSLLPDVGRDALKWFNRVLMANRESQGW